MKVYRIAPRVASYLDSVTEIGREAECVQPMAELIADLLKIDVEDEIYFGSWHTGAVGKPSLSPDFRMETIEVVRLHDRPSIVNALVNALKADVVLGGEGEWMQIRSAVTCRSVRPSWDVNAYLCLGQCEPAPVSTDEDLFIVEECSELLQISDEIDGLDLSRD